MPDGSQCDENECRFYRLVQATITGMFFAGQDTAMPGYGHLGCCHLMVIKQVSDVSAERTQVPAGGEFKCTGETWSVSPAGAARLENLLGCSGPSKEDCEHNRRRVLSRIAAHWHDPIDVNSGHENSDSKMNGDFVDT